MPFWSEQDERTSEATGEYRNGLDAYILYFTTGPMSREVMRTRIPELPDTETQMEYFMDFSAGGFGRLLFRWIENEMEELPDVYAKKASDSILCFMRTAESPRTKPAK